LLKRRVHKRKRGVNCVVRFSQFSGEQAQALFAKVVPETPQKRKFSEKWAKEIMDIGFLRGNTSSPTEVKNYNLRPVGFSQTSVFELKHVTK